MDVELARQHWRDGSRRIHEVRGDPVGHDRLTGRVDVVVVELRRRIGQTFTLQELAVAYDDADRWVRDLLEDADPEAPPESEPGTVADAAFDVYARGASDYRP